MVKIPDWMSTDFSIIDAAWSRKRALDFTSALDVGYIIVKKALRGEGSEFYLLALREFQRMLEQSPSGRVTSILKALDPTPTLLQSAIVHAATRAIVLKGGKPVGVVESPAAAPRESLERMDAVDSGPPKMAGDDAADDGDDGGGGTSDGSGSGKGAPVPRTLVADMPVAVEVTSTTKLTVKLTAEAVAGKGTGSFTASLGAKIDVVVRADPPLEVVGKATHTFTVQDPQTDPPHPFDIKANATGQGRVEIDAFHSGMPVAVFEVTTDVVDALPATVPPAAPKQADMKFGKRPPPDLALYIFERDNEISFMLNAADGSHNMDDYAPVKLRTPREYFQEFFRQIEKLRPKDAEEQLAIQGLNLFRTVLPLDLQRALWAVKDRVQTLQITSDEPWIPWEVCKLEGVVDGNVEEGPFFAEAFKVTRWFRRVPSVQGLTLNKIALVVPDDSSLTSADPEKKYMIGLRSTTREVAEIDPTRTGVVQAMRDGKYDGWHFTGHASATVTTDANQASIELRKPDKLLPTDIVGRTSNFLKTRPLVFFNACQSARGGMALTGIGGWAQQFIKVPPDRSPAGAFIGTYWQVDDDKALEFAKALYDQLTNTVPIGEAVHAARLAAKSRTGEPHDTSWLAYTVYADPSAVVG